MAKPKKKERIAAVSPGSLMARLAALQEEFAEEVRQRSQKEAPTSQQAAKAPAGGDS
jgi:hypothetical protein